MSGAAKLSKQSNSSVSPIDFFFVTTTTKQPTMYCTIKVYSLFVTHHGLSVFPLTLLPHNIQPRIRLNNNLSHPQTAARPHHWRLKDVTISDKLANGINNL
ncbi:hypothetical protein VFPPC_16809 [Pochonia chlamydosporia 170]|uniref:Uncharacterized protein n=1 Tax=Pochonia chlamydosporia 170 TaxID=1380566 RepID=A0A179F345_METCM|nr:hypothetical protein VFPPC_16809 [Pochonia chlamydosporia 170]OAQ59848.1 hypothetical protein VFPPC_16809 [Pochonia chlamydosporia 170]